MRNYIFLSPHFPPNWQNFCERLSQQEFRVLGIGEENYDALSPRLKASLTEYYRVNSMENYEEMIRAVGYFTHKYGKVGYIESHNEHWLELEARLRLDFNVSGYKPADIQFIKRKSKMKGIFRDAGIPVAKGELYKNREQLANFIGEVGYPIIAKPDIGVGAYATYKLENDEDCNLFAENKPSVDYFLEEFVEGKILSYDGLVDQDGKIVFSASLEYIENIMEIVNDDTENHYWIHNHIHEEIEKIGPTAVEAFKPRARFFHLEFFKTKDEQIIALEANLRPPGGYTIDMWNFGNDLDMYEEYVNILARNQMSKSAEFPYVVGFSARKHKYKHRHSHDEILTKYGHLIALHTPIPGAFQKVMGDYAYIFKAADYDQRDEIVNYINEKL